MLKNFKHNHVIIMNTLNWNHLFVFYKNKFLRAKEQITLFERLQLPTLDPLDWTWNVWEGNLWYELSPGKGFWTYLGECLMRVSLRNNISSMRFRSLSNIIRGLRAWDQWGRGMKKSLSTKSLNTLNVSLPKIDNILLLCEESQHHQRNWCI